MGTTHSPTLKKCSLSFCHLITNGFLIAHYVFRLGSYNNWCWYGCFACLWGGWLGLGSGDRGRRTGRLYRLGWCHTQDHLLLTSLLGCFGADQTVIGGSINLCKTVFKNQGNNMPWSKAHFLKCSSSKFGKQ